MKLLPRDVDANMRVIILPEYCPVTVVIALGTKALVRFPGGDEFTVEISTLRRIGSWRDAGLLPRERLWVA